MKLWSSSIKVRERPVWQPVPAEIRAQLNEALPVDETPPETVYQQFRTTILPYATGNLYPRFFGWVHGPGQAGHIVCGNAGGRHELELGGPDHGTNLCRKEVLGWCKHLFGFPPEASGLIVTGTSLANLIALDPDILVDAILQAAHQRCALKTPSLPDA